MCITFPTFVDWFLEILLPWYGLFCIIWWIGCIYWVEGNGLTSVKNKVWVFPLLIWFAWPVLLKRLCQTGINYARSL